MGACTERDRSILPSPLKAVSNRFTLFAERDSHHVTSANFQLFTFNLPPYEYVSHTPPGAETRLRRRGIPAAGDHCRSRHCRSRTASHRPRRGTGALRKGSSQAPIPISGPNTSPPRQPSSRAPSSSRGSTSAPGSAARRLRNPPMPSRPGTRPADTCGAPCWPRPARCCTAPRSTFAHTGMNSRNTIPKTTSSTAVRPMEALFRFVSGVAAGIAALFAPIGPLAATTVVFIGVDFLSGVAADRAAALREGRAWYFESLQGVAHGARSPSRSRRSRWRG